MKSRKLVDARKLLFEFVSICFAVFLGLMLNQWKDNHSHRKLAEQSVDNIIKEVGENKTKVEAMLVSHQKAFAQIDSILSLPDSPIDTSTTSLNVDFNLIGSSAWETAKLTQAISYMDIEMVSDIAMIYTYQEDYYQSMVKDYMNSFIINKPNGFDRETLERLRNFLSGILPVETNLNDYYGILQTKVLSKPK
jgi:hypothetical protein